MNEQQLSIIFTIVLSIVLLVVFIVLLIKPPQKRNSLYGYRTTESMKSDQAWQYANHEFTRCLPLVIVCFLMLSVLKTKLFEFKLNLDLILTLFVALPLPFSILIIHIEKSLKKM